MVHTQILLHTGWGPDQRFQHCFTDRPNQGLVLFVVQASKLFLPQDICNITMCHSYKENVLILINFDLKNQ